MEKKYGEFRELNNFVLSEGFGGIGVNESVHGASVKPTTSGAAAPSSRKRALHDSTTAQEALTHLRDLSSSLKESVELNHPRHDVGNGARQVVCRGQGAGGG